MHMLSGFLKLTFQEITENKGISFDAARFQEHLQTSGSSLRKSISKKTTSDFNSSDWRKFFLLFETTLLPFINDNPSKAICQKLCLLINELSYLLYVPSSPTTNQRRRYLLSSYLLFMHITEHFRQLLKTLYTHYLISCMCERFIEADFELSAPQASTESGESFFARLKKDYRNSNHHTGSREASTIAKYTYRLFFPHSTNHSRSEFSELYDDFASKRSHILCLSFSSLLETDNWNCFLQILHHFKFSKEGFISGSQSNSKDYIFIQFNCVELAK